MAALNGLGSGLQFVPGPAGAGTAMRGQPATPSPSTAQIGAIDGTPVRVVILCVSAALGLAALHMAGFRFNVGVSG